MDDLLTDRLTLRRWRQSDADFALDLYSRLEVQRFIGLTPRLMADRDEALARIAVWQALDDPPRAIWAVQLRSSRQLVGSLLLKSIPASGELPLQPSGETEIGWHFHPDFWGNGYATEAASAVLEHAFAAGLDRVVAVTNPLNVASMNVCARIGMAHLGQTSAYYNATCELFDVSA